MLIPFTLTGRPDFSLAGVAVLLGTGKTSGHHQFSRNRFYDQQDYITCFPGSDKEIN